MWIKGASMQRPWQVVPARITRSRKRAVFFFKWHMAGIEILL